MNIKSSLRAAVRLACLAQALAAGCGWCGTESGTTEAGVIAYWPFDSVQRLGQGNDAVFVTREIAGRREDRIGGHCRTHDGVSGQCLQFNEYDSEIVRAPGAGPAVNPRAFTLEAWIAPRSYPWNWCPIVMQRDDRAGYYLGIDADGRFGLHVAIGGEWHRCDSKMPYPGLETWHQWDSDRRKWIWQGSNDPGPPAPFGSGWGKPVVPLLEWSHLAVTFDAGEGIR
ncbi:MAG: LamG-like jellyroll fold domain-containing protein, partial [Verrucomicrobiota bacterium]